MKRKRFVSKKISSVEFTLFSAEDIKSMAAVKIVTPELYDEDGYPVEGGLMDTRMGVVDPGLKCKTCNSSIHDCLGHFGYIELARPVIHIKFIEKIRDLLAVTCTHCGRILCTDPTAEKYTESIKRTEHDRGLVARRKKEKEFFKYLKTVKKCPHCNVEQKKVKLEKPYYFYEKNARLNNIEVRERLKRISNNDTKLLGFTTKYARPEDMILTNFIIPSVTMRPSIVLETGEKSEDDLTHKLSDIIRINQRLFENINAGAPQLIVEDLWDLLQYHITTYVDNEVAGVPTARHRNGQPLKSLTARLKTKEGRFRYNLVGKRVNYAARAVISADPTIKINEVGVPSEVATKITLPEKVTEWNIDWLRKFVENGPAVYPGANSVLSPEGKKYKIMTDTSEQILKDLTIGWTVERHLIDGDISIFNRQPSLHRMSIMGHRVKVLPGKAFRLSPAVCTPYNADFDGDEMNLHIPQTEEARAEVDHLMLVETQINSPKHGSNVIGSVEDSITGAYLLTKDDVEFDKAEAIQMLMETGFLEVEKMNFKGKKVSGKEIFSALLPEDLDLVIGDASILKGEKGSLIKIEKGKLVEGIVNVNLIGEGKGALLKELYSKYDRDFAVDRIDKFFKLGIVALRRFGFTTGIKDTDISKDLQQKIKGIIKKANEDVDEIIIKFEKGDLSPFPGKTLQETLEVEILGILNSIRNKVSALLRQEVGDDNSTYLMAKSGAKGSTLNLIQMAAIVGQQALRGQRIQFGYKGRTLPFFEKGDLSPKAKGFIESSYKKGLTPIELFYGAMTGRDSLMDLALRTPKSGYLYRRLVNSLQDLKVEYDSTIRDAQNNIVQFTFGDDGIDVSKSDDGTIDVKRIIKQILLEKKKK